MKKMNSQKKIDAKKKIAVKFSFPLENEKIIKVHKNS